MVPLINLLDFDDLGDISHKSFKLALLKPCPNGPLKPDLLVLLRLLIHQSQSIGHLGIKLIKNLVDVLIISLDPSWTEMLDPCKS